MMITFESLDIKQIVEKYLDELVYGIADMDVKVCVDNDAVITCIVEEKETKK